MIVISDDGASCAPSAYLSGASELFSGFEFGSFCSVTFSVQYFIGHCLSLLVWLYPVLLQITRIDTLLKSLSFSSCLLWLPWIDNTCTCVHINVSENRSGNPEWTAQNRQHWVQDTERKENPTKQTTTKTNAQHRKRKERVTRTPLKKTSNTNPTQRTSNTNPTQRTSNMNPTQRTSNTNPTQRTSNTNPTQRTSNTNPTQKTKVNQGPRENVETTIQRWKYHLEWPI
jgi:hypothetical protein